MFEPRLSVTADTFLAEATPGRNFADSGALKVDGAASEIVTLVNIPLPAGLRGSYVSEAPFYFSLNGAWAGSNTITAKRVTTQWQKRKVNYTRRPSTSATNSATVVVSGGSDGDQYSLDLADMLQDVADGAAFYGIELTISTSGTKKLHSSEAKEHAHRPFLSLSYSAASEQAINLQPNGVDIYSDEPMLNWLFLSTTPGASQTMSQVQLTLATDPTFAAVEYDSGEVTNTLEHWDCSAPPSGPAFTPLTDEEDYIWRCRVKDENSWSAWSDVASFSVYSAGTLTIDTPAIDNDDVVDDTPTIEFSFADRDLAVWMPQLFHLVDGDYVEIEDGSFGLGIPVEAASTTGDEWTIPAGLLTKIDTNNRYKVRITGIDTLIRPKGRGDQPYAERVFDYVHSVDVDAPANFTATGSGPYARLDWTWGVATPPDWFIIELDDDHVLEIAGSLAHVSGDDYRWYFTDMLPSPEAHTVTVRAKEDGVGVSDAPAVENFTFQPKGIWVVKGDTAIRLDGRPEIVEEPQQEGETSYALNSDIPRRVSGPPRGYAADISGLLLDTPDGLTALEKIAALEDMWENYADSGLIRLVYGDRASQVIVSPFSKSHNPEDDEGIVIEFTWWEYHEFVESR